MNKRLRTLINAPVSLVKGLRVTMANMRRTKNTVMYPEVLPEPAGRSRAAHPGDPFDRPYEIAPRFRGLHGLTKDPVTGDLNCIGCQACAKVCPDDLISMDLEKREGHSGRYPVTFTVNIGPCCFCGLCAEVCPTPMRAIVMTDQFEWAAYRRDGLNLVLTKEDLERHGDLEVARRLGGREWGPDGELLSVLPEEEGNPYFQFRPEYELERRGKGEAADGEEKPAKPARPPKPEPAATAPAPEPAPQPVAAAAPVAEPEPVAPPAPEPAPAEPVATDPVAELRAALVAVLEAAGQAVPEAPEKLELETLDTIEDRKLRGQAKSALRKLQRALGLVE